MLASDVTDDVTVVVETMQLANSRCRLGPDPSGYNVAASQNVTLLLPERGTAAAGRETLDVWRSCIGWRYPAADDQYMIQLDSIVASADGAFTFTAERDCSYTLTTVRGVSKLPRPRHITAAVSFPLPFHEDFEGATAGGEAPYWGDQMGKWETVPAGGGRDGMASQQQLVANKPWPIQDCRGPYCHSQPLSIIGDMFFVSNQVSADLLIEEPGVGSGLALRMRSQTDPRASWSGLFLYIGSLPGCAPDGKKLWRAPAGAQHCESWLGTLLRLVLPQPAQGGRVASRLSVASATLALRPPRGNARPRIWCDRRAHHLLAGFDWDAQHTDERMCRQYNGRQRWARDCWLRLSADGSGRQLGGRY